MEQNHKLIKAILFDFDGVLSNGRFYSTLALSHPETHKKIIDHIFLNPNKKRIQDWMRGHISSSELHATLINELDLLIEPEELDSALEASVRNMNLNNDLIGFARQMSRKGIKIGILTDNMDVFENIFVPDNNLDEIFDLVISSSSSGRLKQENDAQLLKDTITHLKCNPNETLFIDDSPNNCKAMQKLGGHSYLYHDYDAGYESFINWFNSTFQL